jgi:hypothetical protein
MQTKQRGRPPKAQPEQPSVLQEAHTIIYGEREKTYGAPGKNLETIAAFWTNFLGARGLLCSSLSPEDVAHMMILLKVARLANDPYHRDSLVDVCGYAALSERINL